MFDLCKSRWEVVLANGRVLTEDLIVFDFLRASNRPIDWALDLNTTGDLLKIREIWLIAPGGHRSIYQNGKEVPLMFKIDEPGTAFQFKHKFADFGYAGVPFDAQCIGKVINKEEGDCECWIWDRKLGIISYKSNVTKFGVWREGVIPLGQLSREVIGLRL